MSSFGYSGTIAHGAFEACRSPSSEGTRDCKSLYRNRHGNTKPCVKWQLSLLSEVPRQQVGSGFDESIVSTGVFTPSAEALLSHHIVGGRILLPGVGYLEMTFSATKQHVLKSVAFIRPCVLPEPQPGVAEKYVLRCIRRGQETFEISSSGNTSSEELKFATHFAATCSDLESGHTASTHTWPVGLESHKVEPYKERCRDVLLTKCLQSAYPKHSTAARMQQAETNRRDLSFSMKKPASLLTALRRVRAFVGVMTWQSRHCRPRDSKCAEIDRKKCNGSFRELHMVTRARATQST